MAALCLLLSLLLPATPAVGDPCWQPQSPTISTDTDSASCRPSAPCGRHLHLLAVGGHSKAAGQLSSAELVAGGGATCESVPALPEPLDGPTAGMFAGPDTAVVCGGWRYLHPARFYELHTVSFYELHEAGRECHVLRRGAAGWEPGPRMAEGRALARSVMTAVGMWVTGGRDDRGAHVGTEILASPAGDWAAGPDLPRARDFHCAVQLNDSHSAVVGGHEYLEEGFMDKWSPTMDIYDWTKEEWTRGPDMREGRFGHACVVDGDRLVVAGGVGRDKDLASVEVFDMVEGAWREGTALPRHIGDARLVMLEGTPHLVGGYIEGVGPGSVLLRYGADKWEESEYVMQTPREGMAVIALP